MEQGNDISSFRFTEVSGQRWFWIALGFLGYLFSLYAVLFGLGHVWSVVGLPLVFAPLFIKQLPRIERIQCVAVTSIITYLVFLVILVQNSYFPATMEMILELFFILLITIPAFLIRAPMYVAFGAGPVDAILIISGAIFVSLYTAAIARLPRYDMRNKKMLLAIVLVSVFITCSECIYLGEGIGRLTELSNMDETIRNYYRVAGE